MKRFWIRIVTLGTLWLAAAVPGRGDSGDRCRYPTDPLFSAGHDEHGYFVRAAKRDPAFVGKAQQPVTAVGDYLAAVSHAAIFYLWPATMQAVDGGEWRDPDPLNALRAFAHAGGLDVIPAAPGWWLLGPSDQINSAPVTITTQCLGPAAADWSSAADIDELERALVAQLAVRDVPREGGRGEASLAVQYYWIPEESPGTLLLLTSQQAGESSTEYRGFKVHIGREAAGIKVNCIWAMRANSGPSGQLVPGVTEDFDGDGYRDFVFYSDEDQYVNTIVSGKTGRLLLPFWGAEIAVERPPGGARRLAVDGTYDLDVGAENPHDKEAMHEGPFILAWDRASGQFGPAPGSDRVLTAQAIAQAPGGQFNGPRRALAATLGGANKVRVYLLHPGAHYASGGYEEVPPALQRNPERILFKYSPPTPASKEPQRR